MIAGEKEQVVKDKKKVVAKRKWDLNTKNNDILTEICQG